MNRPADKARQQRGRRRRVTLRRQGTVHARWARVARRTPRGSTLLALVLEVQQRVSSEAEVVRIVRWLVNSGTVVLTGNFAGRRI